MLWHPKTLQNLAMYNVFLCLAVFPLPESYQNDPKFHFNTLLRSDTQKSSKNVENTTVFWSRCENVFGPPPTKADIATAILTNVIEHLVLLLPPNKHAFTAKAVWADLIHPNIRLIVINEGQISVRYFSDESDDLNHGGYGGCFFFPLGIQLCGHGHPRNCDRGD